MSLTRRKIKIQRKYVYSFINNKALNEETAVLLKDIGIAEDKMFEDLLNRGIILEAKDNKYYLDYNAALENKKDKKTRVIDTVLVFGLLAIALYYFFR